jgi:hypothetical protein
MKYRTTSGEQCTLATSLEVRFGYCRAAGETYAESLLYFHGTFSLFSHHSCFSAGHGVCNQYVRRLMERSKKARNRINVDTSTYRVLSMSAAFDFIYTRLCQTYLVKFT